MFSKNASWYGNNSGIELIAEFFSNAEYREWLKTVPALNKDVMSMFENILNFIIHIFTGESKNAYEQLKPMMEEIIDNSLSDITVSEYNKSDQSNS